MDPVCKKAMSSNPPSHRGSSSNYLANLARNFEPHADPGVPPGAHTLSAPSVLIRSDDAAAARQPPLAVYRHAGKSYEWL